MADQWNVTVSVRNRDRNSNNNANNRNNAGNNNNTNNEMALTTSYNPNQQGNNGALSTNVKRTDSNLNATYNGGASGFTSNLIAANGVGPSRLAIVALAAENPSAVPKSMALALTQQPSGVVSMFTTNNDVSSTFWRPNPHANEKGLLQTLHDRKHANDTYLPISIRPPRELECNFSTPDNRLFNINNDQYKLNRTTRAVKAVHNIDDNLNMTGRDMKHGLMGALPKLTTDEYHLMKYRDYSEWAVNHFWKESKKDTFMGKKYVEKYFAMCVGTESGHFIPISEAQFIRGHEILVQQAINDPFSVDGAEVDPHNLTSFALSSDQYNTLRSLADKETNPSVGHFNNGHGSNNQGSYPYDYPSAWDWSPAAIQRRISHYLEQKYKAVGRFIVKTLIVVSVGYLVIGYVRSGKNSNNRLNNGNPNNYNNGGDRPRSRFARNQSRNSGNYYDNNNNNSDGPSLLGAMLTMNPKAVFDYAFAPSK